MDGDEFKEFVNGSVNDLNDLYNKSRQNRSENGKCMWSSNVPVIQSAFLQQWIVTHLNHSNSLPLQELDLLGSMAPAQ